MFLARHVNTTKYPHPTFLVIHHHHPINIMSDGHTYHTTNSDNETHLQPSLVDPQLTDESAIGTAGELVGVHMGEQAGDGYRVDVTTGKPVGDGYMTGYAYGQVGGGFTGEQVGDGLSTADGSMLLEDDYAEPSSDTVRDDGYQAEDDGYMSENGSTIDGFCQTEDGHKAKQTGNVYRAGTACEPKAEDYDTLEEDPFILPSDEDPFLNTDTDANTPMNDTRSVTPFLSNPKLVFSENFQTALQSEHDSGPPPKKHKPFELHIVQLEDSNCSSEDEDSIKTPLQTPVPATPIILLRLPCVKGPLAGRANFHSLFDWASIRAPPRNLVSEICKMEHSSVPKLCAQTPVLLEEVNRSFLMRKILRHVEMVSDYVYDCDMLGLTETSGTDWYGRTEVKVNPGVWLKEWSGKRIHPDETLGDILDEINENDLAVSVIGLRMGNMSRAFWGMREQDVKGVGKAPETVEEKIEREIGEFIDSWKN